MASVAHLWMDDSTLSGGGQFYFTIAKIRGGRPGDVGKAVLEELASSGVDAKRYRVKRRPFPNFEMDTYCDFKTWTDAVADARGYEQSLGLTGTLTWQASDYNADTWYHVIPISVEPQIVYGRSGGQTNDTDSTAILRAHWVLTCTEAV